MSKTEIWGRRARNLAEMGQISARMAHIEDWRASIASYQPRPTDVVISSAAKSGTTLLQQTFHTLRTRGDMDFDDISRVVPWIEEAIAHGMDINADQVAEPRGFKSHLPWDQVPKGAKYIVSLRHPQDAFVSGYRFLEGWLFEPGSISYEDYFEPMKAAPITGYDHWSHLIGWWNQRDNPAVLLMSYEHMVEEPELMIRRVADFCDIRLDDALLAVILEHTSRAFMLRFKDRFDDAMAHAKLDDGAGLPPGDSAKVREAGEGARRYELPESIRAAFDSIWLREVTPKTGFADYDSLEAALRGLTVR